MTDVPYIPGPSSLAPAGPARTAPATAQARPETGQPHPVLAGERVDLAHELRQLRRLLTAILVLLSLTSIMALVAAVSSGWVALELYRFIDALQRAFG